MTLLIYGERVRQARVLRRTLSTELAEALSRAPSAITRMESSDTVEMLPEALDKLQGLLRFPAKFFMTPPVPISTLQFRVQKKVRKRDIEYQEQFARLAAELLYWLDGRISLPPLRIPSVTAGTTISEAAAAVREAFGLAPYVPVPHLTHSAERAGIPVVVRRRRLDDEQEADQPADSTERHLGYSLWGGKDRRLPVIVMRPVDSWERTRWTVAHEIGHLTLHKEKIDDVTEAEANAFATELLAPIAALKQELPRVVTLSVLVGVKAKWHVSIGALVKHLHANNVIDAERLHSLQRQLYSRRNPETGTTFGVHEPGWNSQQPERPRMISAWIDRSLGAARPEIVASTSGLWPADIIGEILAEQRQAEREPGTAQNTKPSSASGTVVDLHVRRTSKLARSHENLDEAATAPVREQEL